MIELKKPNNLTNFWIGNEINNVRICN